MKKYLTPVLLEDELDIEDPGGGGSDDGEGSSHGQEGTTITPLEKALSGE